jgi:hypothetical protein
VTYEKEKSWLLGLRYRVSGGNYPVWLPSLTMRYVKQISALPNSRLRVDFTS